MEQGVAQTVSSATLKAWLHDGQEIALLDVREHGQYGEAHLFYATSVPYSVLEQEVTRLVPRRGTRMVVYDAGDASTPQVAERAAARLVALGYTEVHVLEGGAAAWQGAGYVLFAGVNLPSKTFGELVELAYHTPRVTATQLAAMLQGANAPVVIDGRPAAEFRKMSIPTATCCPNGELAYRIAQLVPDAETPIVINCAGRTRSIIGAQTLINLGVSNPVYALENGTQGWYLTDHQLDHGSRRLYPEDSGSTALAGAAQQLAARFPIPTVDAATVRAWAVEPGRSLYLCDVRTAEEFAVRSLPGARHTPGGQMLQAADQFVGVRGARLVLFDSDGTRAPTVASWLFQMGHDVSILANGLESGLALDVAVIPEPPPLATIDAQALATRLAAGSTVVLDLRAGMVYRAGHIPQAFWAIRPRLAEAVVQHLPANCQVVLVADDATSAAWAVASDWPQHVTAPLLLAGGMQAWLAAGYPEQATPDNPPDAACIDYLFFVHDRHDGNKEAAQRYLDWETGLVAQLDAQERAGFRLP
nr:rhodanese-like domain-containing protein [Ottowia thiooxydans]